MSTRKGPFKTDNPWEILVLAAATFFPAITLLLHRGPVLLVNFDGKFGVNTVLCSANTGRTLGIIGIVFSLVLVAVYLRIQRSASRTIQR